MGMRSRNGEYDASEWQRHTQRCDPIILKSRYSDPYELERTLLSPVISEATELSTCSHSLRTVPSQLTHLSNSSCTESDHSVASAPPTESPTCIHGMSKHLERLAGSLKAKSTPALRVQAVSLPEMQSMRALPEQLSPHQDAQDSEAGRSPRDSTDRNSTSPTLRRTSSRPARLANIAEGKFVKRVAAQRHYTNRKAMLATKDQLVRRLQACHSVQDEVAILHRLGELYLHNAVEGPSEDSAALKQRSAEVAIVWLRRAIEKQDGDLDSWYLLGRAHEAYAAAVDEPEKSEHRHHALASYAQALERAQDSHQKGRILCSLGVLYCSANCIDHAREAFQKAVATDATQARAYLNLGQLWSMHYSKQATDENTHKECMKQAALNYQRVLELDPTNEHARMNLAALPGQEPKGDRASVETGAESSLLFDEERVLEESDAGDGDDTAATSQRNAPAEPSQSSRADGTPPTSWPDPPATPKLPANPVSNDYQPDKQSVAQSSKARSTSVASKRSNAEEWRRLEDMMAGMLQRQTDLEAAVSAQNAALQVGLDTVETKLMRHITEIVSRFNAHSQSQPAPPPPTQSHSTQTSHARRPSFSSFEGAAPNPPRASQPAPMMELLGRLGGANVFTPDAVHLAAMVGNGHDFVRSLLQVLGVLALYTEQYRVASSAPGPGS